jgi:hypothetical protein
MSKKNWEDEKGRNGEGEKWSDGYATLQLSNTPVIHALQ